MKTSDFKKGMRVRYVPSHILSNMAEALLLGEKVPDGCEDGIVSSTNELCVFVKYDNKVMRMTTGDEPYTSQATEPGDLIIL